MIQSRPVTGRKVVAACQFRTPGGSSDRHVRLDSGVKNALPPVRGPGRRVAPLVLVAGAAFIWGVGSGARYVPPVERAAKEFTSAWARGDYARMYAQVDERTRASTPVTAFADAYRAAAATATTLRIRFGKPGRTHGDEV